MTIAMFFLIIYLNFVSVCMLVVVVPLETMKLHTFSFYHNLYCICLYKHPSTNPANREGVITLT